MFGEKWGGHLSILFYTFVTLHAKRAQNVDRILKRIKSNRVSFVVVLFSSLLVVLSIVVCLLKCSFLFVIRFSEFGFHSVLRDEIAKEKHKKSEKRRILWFLNRDNKRKHSLFTSIKKKNTPKVKLN